MKNAKNAWKRFLLIALGCFLVSCGSLHKSNPETAIRQAIEEHLAGRTGLASDKIVMELKQVQVNGDRAEADVVFHSRTDPKALMAFHYQLRSEGKQWKVENGHPSAESLPHPPPMSPSDAAPALPEGHPPAQQ